MKRILIAAAAAFASLACVAEPASTSWAGCYLVEGDHIEIRREGNQHFVRAGTDRGEEVRLVMRSATPEELGRVQWYPPRKPVEGLVSDRATVGTRIVEDHPGTLPLLGMYRTLDGNGREGLLGFFPFAIGPAQKEACPAPKPPAPSEWAGCYEGRGIEMLQVRQDADTLYIENEMEGMFPTRLVFRPATPADLNAFAAGINATAKGVAIEVPGGLALYGTAIATHHKPAENKGEPRMGIYRVRESGTESLYLFFPFTLQQVAKVPCAAKR